MAYDEQNPGVPIPNDWLWEPGGAFPGFARPISNTTYTPNQFFDVCLPHYSRGVVRLVAYMIRKTLGWCDTQGNPQDEQILISYQDLVDNAGISRGAISDAIKEAVAGKFIRCIREGRSKSVGQSAVSALYSLRWDNGPEYIKDPKRFKGFFEGEGNRTDIPNQFFDDLIPKEPLAVLKVVGAVIRFSIGFQAKRGRRRQEVALSYRDIQFYTRLGGRTALSHAVHHAIRSGYIVCTEAGVFDPNAGLTSKAATYSLRWTDTSTYGSIGSKSVPEDRFKKGTGIGSKSVPEDRFKKCTGIQIKQTNNTSKQQQGGKTESRPPTLAAVALGVFEKLSELGFGEKVARQLAITYPAQRITDQIHWLALRSPQRNALGMLRRAIEENWPEPQGELQTSETASTSAGLVFARHFFAGIGGNPNEPTAEPSAREVEAAERYTARLLEFLPNPSWLPKWGRRFGELVRSRPGRGGQPITSLVLALRVYGDEFFHIEKQTNRRELAQARHLAWERHEQQHKAGWLAYLRETEAHWRDGRPEMYASFEAHREAERDKFRRSPFRPLADSALRVLETEEARLQDFQRFFRDEVLDFGKWDEQCNPERFPGLVTTP